MTETPTQLAAEAVAWSTAASNDLLDAAKVLASLGIRVADAGREPHPDFSLARSGLDDAWEIVTQRVLPNLGQSKAMFLAAAQASARAKQKDQAA